MTIKGIFNRFLSRLGGGSEEDKLIERFKQGDCEPLIDYFKSGEIPFKAIDHRRKVSPTGRVMYEDDIYSYAYIDGLWVNRYELPLPYDVRRSIFERTENAVMSNVHGTVAYEEKHFGTI